MDIEHLLTTEPSLLPVTGNCLSPVICGLDGRIWSTASLSQKAMDLLNNQTKRGEVYPLHLNDGMFYSEVLSHSNKDRAAYLGWIQSVLALINKNKVIPFDEISLLGKAITKLDEKFALKKVQQTKQPDAIDAIHRSYGPNAKHPYRKITLCRTAINIDIKGKIHTGLFEKYLVVYSYLDEQSSRQSTRTPIHTHPYNQEVVYFLSHGEGSKVTEEHFSLITSKGRNLTNDLQNPESSSSAIDLTNLQAIPEKTEVRNGTDLPFILEDIEADKKVWSKVSLLNADCIFRPHRVTVSDSIEKETLYYAINNYWSLTGRVLLLESKQAAIWSHDEWL